VILTSVAVVIGHEQPRRPGSAHPPLIET
jgi:hypothetical protein